MLLSLSLKYAEKLLVGTKPQVGHGESSQHEVLPTDRNNILSAKCFPFFLFFFLLYLSLILTFFLPFSLPLPFLSFILTFCFFLTLSFHLSSLRCFFHSVFLSSYVLHYFYKLSVIYVVTLCSFVGRYQCFEGFRCLLPQGRRRR